MEPIQGNENVNPSNTGDAAFAKPQPPVSVEMQEEMKLRSKYPNIGRGGGAANSILQKRMHKAQKYFDSGDYNMAKAKINQKKAPLPQEAKLLVAESTGEAIPTPESVPHPHRKPSLISKLASAEGASLTEPCPNRYDTQHIQTA